MCYWTWKPRESPWKHRENRESENCKSPTRKPRKKTTKAMKTTKTTKTTKNTKTTKTMKNMKTTKATKTVKAICVFGHPFSYKGSFLFESAPVSFLGQPLAYGENEEIREACEGRACGCGGSGEGFQVIIRYFEF